MTPTYYPHPELKPLRECHPTRIVERKICRKAIRVLHAAGFDLRVHSGEEFETPAKATEDNLMRALFNLDDAWLIVSKHRKQKGWLRFVFGNDGWDVLSDYTTNLEEVIKEVNEYANKFDDDV